MKLSVLDQSPVPEGTSQQEAIQNTVKLAIHAENLGYHRFWVSEHHDNQRLAGSSPEVLISHIAAKTSKIKVGSGGIMLPHYSPYKVAENFKVLEALHQGRINLGIGRAPGGNQLATMALQEGRWQQGDRYLQQIDELLAYLHDNLPEDHRFYGLRATPQLDSPPDVWVLGSSEASAQIAAYKGLPYVFAKFISGDGGDAYTSMYHDHFRPSKYLQSPKNIVAVFVICAEDEEKAKYLASSHELSLLWNEQGKRVATPHPETALNYPYSDYEQYRLQENRKRMIVGDPKQVKEQFIKLCEDYQTDEIMLVTITHDFAAKLKSFELIAKEIL